MIQRTGKSDTAVVGWGRGMGHKGHMLLARAVIVQAQNMGADPYFFVSRTVGADDPLYPEEKLYIYKKVFPKQANIFQSATDDIPDINRLMRTLAELGYKNAVLVVGADQVKAFQYLVGQDKAGNTVYKTFGLDNLQVIKRQDVDDAAQAEEGPRATPMRDILKDPNASDEQKFAVWRDAMPDALSDEEVLALMQKAAQRMGEFKPATKKAKVKEFIQRVRPMLKEANAQQKLKLLKLMKESLQELNEFAPEDGEDNGRKFIPWEDFVRHVANMVGDEFSVKMSKVPKQVKAVFTPHDATKYGPTQIYAYWDRKGVAIHGGFQIGSYQKLDKLYTHYKIGKLGDSKYVDFTLPNVSRFADIILGNTEGAYQMQSQGVAEGWKSKLAGAALGAAALGGIGKVVHDNPLVTIDGITYDKAITMPDPDRAKDLKVQTDEHGNKIYTFYYKTKRGYRAYYYPAEEQVNEFLDTSDKGGDDYAEYVVYEASPDDPFKWKSNPLFQSDSLPQAHGFAFKLWKKFPDKAFMVYQPSKGLSRGEYGPSQVDEFLDDRKGGDDDGEISKIVSTADKLLKKGYRVDLGVVGAMGQVVRADFSQTGFAPNGALAFKRKTKNYIRPFLADDDEKYEFEMVSPKHYKIVDVWPNDLEEAEDPFNLPNRHRMDYGMRKTMIHRIAKATDYDVSDLSLASDEELSELYKQIFPEDTKNQDYLDEK